MCIKQKNNFQNRKKKNGKNSKFVFFFFIKNFTSVQL